MNKLWESMRWPSLVLRSCSSANLQCVIDFTSDLGISHYMTSNPWWYLYLGKTKLMTYAIMWPDMIYHANHISCFYGHRIVLVFAAVEIYFFPCKMHLLYQMVLVDVVTLCVPPWRPSVHFLITKYYFCVYMWGSRKDTDCKHLHHTVFCFFYFLYI